MKKRIIPLFFLVLLLATVMIPTSAAISTKAISGKPTLKIEGTTAYCVGKYNSGNRVANGLYQSYFWGGFFGR